MNAKYTIAIDNLKIMKYAKLNFDVATRCWKKHWHSTFKNDYECDYVDAKEAYFKAKESCMNCADEVSEDVELKDMKVMMDAYLDSQEKLHDYYTGL